MTRAAAWGLLLALLVTAPAQADPAESLAEAQALFDDARRLEESQPSAGETLRARYRAAAARFAAIHRDEGVVSAHLFVNAGNAYHFAGDPGQAALWWLRALTVDPDEPRAQSGLRAQRRRLPWTPPPSVAADLLGTLFFWHTGLPFATRRALFILLWPLGWLLLALGLRRRDALRWAGAGALVLGTALFVSLAVSSNADPAETQGVVVIAAEGRSGDGASYSRSHSAPLPPGSEVRILEARRRERDWLHVELPDGSRAWIPAETVARVIPR